MEFAAAALTSIGSAFGAGAPLNLLAVGGMPGAAAGGGLFAGLGSMSTWASILSGGATVASVLSASRSGDEKARSLDMQADDADATAKLESVQGLERRSSIKAALLQAIGERDVAASASGVDLSFGTPTLARDQAVKDAERAIASDQNTEDFRRSRLLERAASYRAMAADARAGGLGKAAALTLDGAAKLARRE